MNLLKLFGGAKPEVGPSISHPLPDGAKIETADLTPKAKTMHKFTVRVPAGFALPEGGTITQPFDLSVEAGVRWHPEWDEPRITVNTYRFMPMGDALCWSGDAAYKAYQSLLGPEVEVLALWHGKTLSEAGRAAGEALNRLGLSVPTEKQPVASFIAHR